MGVARRWESCSLSSAMAIKEIYVSTDIEADGPCPGVNSMLSFGSAAFTEDGNMIDTFSRNLELLKGAVPNPETMAWWGQPEQKQAFAACREKPVDILRAMKDYDQWIKLLPGKPVCVCYPAGFDFTFIYYYLNRFVGSSPFGFSALDIKSYAMCALGLSFRDTTKRGMPQSWFPPKAPHTHVALDDAIEQGQLFINMLRDSRKVSLGR
jgi:hypothetical protein